MQERTLLEVDARIAKLRDKVAAGDADKNDSLEIDRLIEQRMALIHARAARLGNQQPQNISARS
jgi:hypothetical protein